MTSRALTIGKLASAAGVIVETIRYYQRIGLIEQPQKPAYGFRYYPQDAVDRVRFIKRAQQLGFSLDEVRELLALDAGRCDDARRLAADKLTQIGARIAALQALQHTLQVMMKACKRKEVNLKCPIIAALLGKRQDTGERRNGASTKRAAE